MENATRPHKKVNGDCPYCESSDSFITEGEYRGLFLIQKHTACNKYSHLHKHNGIRYPLQNPTDQNSSSYI